VPFGDLLEEDYAIIAGLFDDGPPTNPAEDRRLSAARKKI
jgi:hypothetical protein